MKNDSVFTDRRLLQAIDLIDPKFVAEVFDDLKVPDTSKGYVSDKRGLHRAYRQFIALAACLILLSRSRITCLLIMTSRQAVGEAGQRNHRKYSTPNLPSLLKPTRIR